MIKCFMFFWVALINIQMSKNFFLHHLWYFQNISGFNMNDEIISVNLGQFYFVIMFYFNTVAPKLILLNFTKIMNWKSKLDWSFHCHFCFSHLYYWKTILLNGCLVWTLNNAFFHRWWQAWFPCALEHLAWSYQTPNYSWALKDLYEICFLHFCKTCL